MYRIVLVLLILALLISYALLSSNQGDEQYGAPVSLVNFKLLPWVTKTPPPDSSPTPTTTAAPTTPAPTTAAPTDPPTLPPTTPPPTKDADWITKYTTVFERNPWDERWRSDGRADVERGFVRCPGVRGQTTPDNCKYPDCLNKGDDKKNPAIHRWQHRGSCNAICKSINQQCDEHFQKINDTYGKAYGGTWTYDIMQRSVPWCLEARDNKEWPVDCDARYPPDKTMENDTKYWSNSGDDDKWYSGELKPVGYRVYAGMQSRTEFEQKVADHTPKLVVPEKEELFWKDKFDQTVRAPTLATPAVAPGRSQLISNPDVDTPDKHYIDIQCWDGTWRKICPPIGQKVINQGNNEFRRCQESIDWPYAGKFEWTVDDGWGTPAHIADVSNIKVGCPPWLSGKGNVPSVMTLGDKAQYMLDFPDERKGFAQPE